MKIHSLSKIIALPFAVAFALVLLWTFESNYANVSYWLIPPFIAIAIIYIFNPQIDFWWHKRNPPPIDKSIINWVEKYSSYYKLLLVPDKIKFLKRLSIYLHGKEFSAMGQKEESVPEDIKAVVGHLCIQITMGQEDFMLEDFDRIILYKHPFPTPLKKFLHSVETHNEDGVIILSLEQLINGIMNSSYYNTGMHAYVEAFVYKNQQKDYPEFDNDIWGKLEAISGMKMDRVNAILGFEQKDPLIVAINYFFCYPVNFNELEPKLYANLQSVFNQDPASPSGIVVENNRIK
jgi:hypothetical protein